MSSAPAQELHVSPRSAFAVELHQLLLNVEGLSAVADILTLYRRHFGAFGSALWEVAEGVGLEQQGRLFIQAQSFDGLEQPPFYHLEMSSISGRCIRENRAAMHSLGPQGWDANIPVTYPEILASHGITSFISVPVQQKTRWTAAADATITFYRRGNPFTVDEFEEICSAASLLPAAYRSIQDRASLALLARVREVLRESRDAASDAAAQARKAMTKVLAVIASHFQFIECVVYLHNPATDPPERFNLVAARWLWSLPPLGHYQPGDGGTGWVLQHGRPLRILDMALYSDDREYYRQCYPGMEWSDRVDIRSEVRQYFHLPGEDTFPLSYACVPVVYRDSVTGALRCCISRSGPYHVDDDILQILCTAAELIADWWDHRTREQQQREEGAAASSIMNSLGSANRYAVQNLQQSSEIEKIIVRILEVCRKSVPQADIVEIWLENPSGLLVRAQGPGARNSLPKTASLEETLGSKKQNAFRYALNNPMVLHQRQADTSPFSPPGADSLASFTVAPVIGQGARGVLLFAASSRVAWPDTICSASMFLAEQLALYLSLNLQFLGLREVQEKLERSALEQVQLLLDFQHQLRTPINIARNSLDELRQRGPSSPDWPRVFEALASSTRRAGTVANNLQFFVNLAQGKNIAPSWIDLDPIAILETVDQCSNFLYNKGALGRNITFDIRKKVDDRKKYAIPLPHFRGDRNLILLAIDNILDNSVKYSYDNTSVIVEAESALYGREIYFSFQSQGLPISPEEAPKLKQRGYRGARAKVTSPEGTGVGLWMVAEMMRAMDGRLEIRPTNADGWNDFRIYFRGLPG
jgi:signal transduction histidine kinase